MSRKNRGEMYFPPESGCRVDNWEEDSKKGKGKDPKKEDKKNRNKGGSTRYYNRVTGKFEKK